MTPVREEAMPLETAQAMDLHDLLRRRDELVLRLDRQKTKIHHLSDELRRVDAVLGAGEASPEDIPVNELFARRLGREAGELTRLIGDMFEGAPAGLTSRDIALRLMSALALDTAQRRAVRYVGSRVCVVLWTLEQKGLVRKVDTSRIPQVWQWAAACRPA
jgi:hypothetical protein